MFGRGGIFFGKKNPKQTLMTFGKASLFEFFSQKKPRVWLMGEAKFCKSLKTRRLKTIRTPFSELFCSGACAIKKVTPVV